MVDYNRGKRDNAIESVWYISLLYNFLLNLPTLLSLLSTFTAGQAVQMI